MFCFVSFSSFLLSLKPGPFVLSFFDMHTPRQPHAVTQRLSVSAFVLFICCFLEDAAFSEYFVPLSFPL